MLLAATNHFAAYGLEKNNTCNQNYLRDGESLYPQTPIQRAICNKQQTGQDYRLPERCEGTRGHPALQELQSLDHADLPDFYPPINACR